MNDMRGMTVGQIVDFVISYNERNKTEADADPRKPTKRKATQNDINAFFG